MQNIIESSVVSTEYESSCVPLRTSKNESVVEEKRHYLFLSLLLHFKYA